MRSCCSTVFASLAVLCAAVLGTGCERAGAPEGKRTPPNPRAPAAYGPPAIAPAVDIPRARAGGTAERDLESVAFGILQTELSPLVMVRATSRTLDLFAGSTNAGLAAPSFVAWATPNGPRPFRRGEKLDVADMRECWVLVWWAGAKGWDQWDSPWVVFLQHPPQAMRLDDDGLHFNFPGPAGDVVLLPLYGYEKLPQKGRNFLAEHGLAGRKVQTWDWADVLKRGPLTRVRYWAAASREIPIDCQESLSVDRARDAVTIRSRFRWHSIHDDWKTPHLKLAPLSPPLGQAAKLGEFPVSFSKSWSDLDLATPYGPCLVIEGVDQFDATFSVLQYVNEAEAWDPPQTNTSPVVTRAWARLREVSAAKFPSPERYRYDHGGLENFCWSIQGDGWYAKGLPYFDAPTRSNALACLRRYFREDVLVTNRFQWREFPRGSGRQYAILEGPGIGSWGVLGDAGKVSANLLQTLWAYAHYTGDWELVRERWPLIKRLFTTPAETRWVGFGRDAIAELGDEAAPCAAFARLAYQAGDMDSYHYACAQFARELVLLFLKQRGAEYFRQHQPWHSLEFMDDEVFLTNLWGDTAGWQLDGPQYPARIAERQFNNRWVRFHDLDVARFYREYLAEDVRRELDWLQPRWEPKRRWQNDSHLFPSLVQLRSLLLNDTPAALALVAAPEQFTGPPSGIIASCIAILRTSHPTRFDRLIPPGPPSAFVTGLDREVSGPNPYLLTGLQTSPAAAKTAGEGTPPVAWPQLTWWGWKSPTGARWTFGAARPVHGSDPPGDNSRVRMIPLSWNTRVAAYDLK